MLVIAYISLIALVSAALVLYLKVVPSGKSIDNPAFVTFQRKYFVVYLVALFAEWLQNPYLYRIYSQYGYIDTQIAIIYVCGFVSSVVFSMVSRLLPDKCGRKKSSLFFIILYSISCLSKASDNYSVLILGRILGGISTSVLFTAFESWYVYEHKQTHDFPTEWIEVTFTKASFLNGVVAVIAGILANFLTEWINFGPVSPFLLAIPFLVIAGLIILVNWEENYGGKSLNVMGPCVESLRLIVSNPKILLIGMITALFESVMFVFVFLWTPVLDPARPPLGIVFSCFMACVMIGGLIFRVATTKKVAPVSIIQIAIVLGLLANLTSSIASANHPRKTFLAFLLMEFSCGLYFPAMGRIRQHLLPEIHHAGIMNWFRVPLNLIASVVLLALHDTHSSKGITTIFGICSIIMIVAGICAVRFSFYLDNGNLLQDNEENSNNDDNNLV